MDLRKITIISVIFNLLVWTYTMAQTSISGTTNTCEGNTNTYSFSAPSGSGYLWTVSGGSIVGSATQSSVQVLWNSSGTRSVGVVVNTFSSATPSPLCGFCDRYMLSVNVSLPTVAGTLASSSSTVCSNASVNLSITGNRGLPTAWRVRSKIGSGAWSNWSTFSSSSSTSRNYTVTNSSSSQKTYEFQTIVANGNCIPHYTNTKRIYVDAPTQAGTLSYSGGSTVCSGSSVNLSLTGKLGTIQSWRMRSRIGSSSWSSWSIFSTSTSTSRSYTVSNSSSIQKTYEFQVLVDNGACTSKYSNTVALSVNSQSIGGAATGAQDHFGMGTGQIELQNNRGNVIKWEQKSGSSNWADINGQTSTTLSYTDVDQTTKYRAVVQNGNCGAQTSSEVEIIIHNVPNLVRNGPENIAPGGFTELSTTGGFFSYVWKRDGIVLPGETNSSLVISKPGAYSVTVQAVSGGATYTTAEYTIGSAVTDQPYNYITTTDYLVEGIDMATDIFDLQTSDYSVITNYFDGLGRQIQTNALGSSPGGYDVITSISYDDFGRQDREYLPYAAMERLGSYDINASTNRSNFYRTQPFIAHTDSTYARKVYELSSLNRVLEQGAPGEVWQPSTDNTVKFVYDANASGEVFFWDIDFNTDALRATGHYSNGQLTKTITTDEEGHAVIEFVDKLGQTVLKRVQANEAATEWADTYYIYNDFGSLRYVLPPEAVKEISSPSFPYTPSSTLLATWAFQYKYDGRQRIIEKKVPGAEPVYMIYDKRDRLVMIQDGNQRIGSKNEWTFTKYDALNRPVLTGIIDKGLLTIDQIRTEVDAISVFFEDRGSAVHGYTNNSYPSVGNANSYLTVTYYDDYTFPHASAYPFVPELGNTAAFDRVKGRVTGAKIKILDGSNTWLDGVTYYDNRYRIIQTQTETLLGGVDRVTNRYDFIGQVLETRTTHEGPKIFDIQWIDVVGVTVEDDNSLTKSTNSGWSNGGAASANILPAGEDGWIEMEVAETNLARMFGLSDINQNEHYNTIDYAIYPNLHGQVLVFENGVNRGSKGTYQTGDKLSVERVGNQIFYKKNGTLLYPSTISSTTSLIVDVSLYNVSSTIKSPKASFGSLDSEENITVTRTYDYDHAGRLINKWHQINDQDQVLLASNVYNELGELIEKNLHQTSPAGGGAGGGQFAQSVDYRYNIRGWLTSINNAQLTTTSENNDTGQATDYWGMELGYNNALTGVTANPAYNGNISAVKWSDNLGLGNATNIKERGYAYTYDPMNRIKTADHSQYTSAWTANNHFKLDGLTYDLNGNIESLTRKDQQGGNMDVLAYTYGGNQLLRVTDSGDDNQGFKDGTNPGDDYLYDDNGNMTQDLNKDITSITYNHLNLPARVEKGANNYILYTYDASGIKLRQDVYQDGALTKTTDYVGEFIYENDELQLIQHEEGRYIPPSGGNEGGVYQYHLKDHLGNTRVTFTTQPETLEFQATMESENATDEEALFSNLAETRATYLNANHTAGGNEAVRLNQTKPVGPALSLPVGAGDIVDLEVYAYYESGSGYNSTISVASMVAAVASAFGGVNGGTEAQQAVYNGFDGALGTVGGTSNSTVPAAYLNYVFFDENLVSYQEGFKQISGAANTNHERVHFDDQTLQVSKPGFVYIWVSNNSATNNWVYFDELKVTLTEHPVIQTDDYYPFGLTHEGGYKRVTAKKNDFLFNGIERETELDLGWDLAEYRAYDATIGRWLQVDPKTSERESPYVAFANNPVKYVDPLGDTIRDNNDIVANYRSYLNNRISALQTMLDNEDFDFQAVGTSREAVSGLVSNLQQANSEIDVLESSEQVYNISVDNTLSGDQGYNEYNSETGAINIGFSQNASNGVIGHELFHSYQYEMGQISFAADNSFYGALYDLSDETASYQRQHLITGENNFGANTTNTWTRNFGARIGAYQGLPEGPVDINSRQGLHLRFMTIYRGRELGLPIREVFNGWQIHHNAPN